MKRGAENADKAAKPAVSAVFTSKARQFGDQTNKRQNTANQIKSPESD
jgi:hypothetical protein